MLEVIALEVIALEEAFDTEIPDDDAEKIRGLRDAQEVLEYIRKRKKGDK